MYNKQTNKKPQAYDNTKQNQLNTESSGIKGEKPAWIR